MTPDDPRHGSPGGYVAGCRDSCCSIPRMRQSKIRRGLNLRGVPALVCSDDVDKVMRRWQLMGVSRTAVQIAAGVKSENLYLHKPVTLDTYNALAAVTEDALRPTVSVYSDLTRRRVYSLMAIGQELQSMPLNKGGTWRDRERITVGVARTMRDHYAANEFRVGTSTKTASRARNAGHVPPLAWDDPGTLAWPNGTPAPLWSPVARVGGVHGWVDDSTVRRVLAGEHHLVTTSAEKRAIMAGWLAQGRSETTLCKLMGWRPGRYAPRLEETG